MGAVLNERKFELLFNSLNHTIMILTGTYIFLNPLPFSAVSEFCFYLSLLLLIVLTVLKKNDFTLHSPLTLPFILFFLWAVFGLFFALDFKNSLHDLHGNYLKHIIIFYLLVNYFNSQKKLEIISYLVIASATVFSVGALIQYYFIEGFPLSVRLGLNFKEIHTDYIGFITIFAITLALNLLHNSKTLTSKLLFSTCIAILCVTTLLTQSRGSLIGLFIALVISCFINNKMIIFVIATILVIVSIPNMKNRITNEAFTKDARIKINRLSLEVIKEHPITGIGFGMQIYHHPEIVGYDKLNSLLTEEFRQKEIIASPHNTFLDIAIRTGIIGLALFFNILISSLFMLYKTLKLAKNEFFRSWTICLFACFISFLLPALFADTTFGQRVVVFYSMLAMINILWNLAQQEKTQESLKPCRG
jgi:putative inorganic carbon (hco3(-)) transporter